MIRTYLLDTNMVSYILKSKSPAARKRLESLTESEAACVPTVTEAELRFWVAKSGAGEKWLRLIEWFLSGINVYAWGREEAATFGVLRAKQEAMGRPLSPFDMQLAAHAVSLGATLVTRDAAFHHVPDLAGIENWATDM